jgi:hypothetical protein
MTVKVGRPAKRGDLIVYRVLHTSVSLVGRSANYHSFEIGKVVGVSRQGVVNKHLCVYGYVDKCVLAPPTWLVSGETIDADAVMEALGKERPEFRSLEEVRDFFLRFRRGKPGVTDHAATT